MTNRDRRYTDLMLILKFCSLTFLQITYCYCQTTSINLGSILQKAPHCYRIDEVYHKKNVNQVSHYKHY